MQLSRKQFLQTSILSATGLALGPSWIMAASKEKIPIGFQLYTVRGELARDVPGTIKRLAEIGYQAVEFWGYAGTPDVYQKYSASALRKMLDEANLKCCGMHLELKALAKENIDVTIENNKILGNEFLNVAAAKEKMGSKESIAELAGLLNQAQAVCGKQQMTVGYHAHPFDFVKIDGRFAWEWLFQRTEPGINMQMDVGNCLSGNGDPIAMLKEFPGRTWSIHIKEHENKSFDSDYYREVFKLCETACGTKWYIVEMGGPEGKGFDIPKDALVKLRQLGK